MSGERLDMRGLDEFVQRIVSHSGIVSRATRTELERELRDHLEDAAEDVRAEEHDEARVRRIVCDRFGDPDEVARELARAHRFERRAVCLGHSLALMAVSMLAVAGLVLTFQWLVAVCTGRSAANAFPHLRGEIVGFGALTLGYTGLYLEERLFRTRRLLKACLMNSAVFVCLFTMAFLMLHTTQLTPVLPFVSGLAVRTLQQTALRSAWFLGTAVPMAVASLAGAIANGAGHLPDWAAMSVIWTGLTAACYLLTLLSRQQSRLARVMSHEL